MWKCRASFAVNSSGLTLWMQRKFLSKLKVPSKVCRVIQAWFNKLMFIS
jgi:hypothetical protein